MASLDTQDFLEIDDLSRVEIESILRDALDVKRGSYDGSLDTENLGMVFQKRSTRTRVSFEAGMNQLGGDGVFLSQEDIQLGRGETIGDTGRSLSRYLDVLMARVYSHDDLQDLAEYSDIPVINGLSNFNHPCQALSDLFTLTEVCDRTLEEVSVAWLGDGNNVCHSLMVAAAMVGMDISVATPSEHRPSPEVEEKASGEAEVSGSSVVVTNSPEKALDGADAVYTDSWVSMGDDDKDLGLFEPFQVTEEVLDRGSDDCVFMHCLPAHRGHEVVDEVIDGDRSVVWRQAENRMHVQKTLILSLLGSL
ncbi:MAG: ornithine carbamoyltransferase [Halobacteria archaeon]